MNWLTQWRSRLAQYLSASFPRCAYSECAFRAAWRRLLPAHGIQLQQQWYCSPQCFESAARRCFSRASITPAAAPRGQHRIPLGLVLLSRGQLSNTQLRSALQAQRENGCGRIGQWLEKMGFATEEQVTSAMGMQWACPVLPASAVSSTDFAATLPIRLLENFRMLPVHFSRERVLYLAFSEGVDYTALYAIEQALQCRTEACLVGSTTMEAALARLVQHRRAGDCLFEDRLSDAEMARITCGCVIKLGAREVRIVACGEYVWARLEPESGPTNLLFRRPESVAVVSDQWLVAGVQ
jgi:Type II secretion system (T2SS), protein E, N-terminal domain